MSKLTDVLAAHRSEGLRCMLPCGYQASSRDDHIAHIEEAIAAARLAVVELPKPDDSTPSGRQFFSVWGMPAVIAEPRGEVNVDSFSRVIPAAEARDFAAAILAAANAAEAVSR